MKTYEYARFAKDLIFTLERRILSHYRDNLGGQRAMEHGESK